MKYPWIYYLFIEASLKPRFKYQFLSILSNMKNIIVILPCVLTALIPFKRVSTVRIRAVLSLGSHRSRPWIRHRRPSYRPLPSWLVNNFLEYKAGLSGRKRGIWKSRTTRTSTSCEGLIPAVGSARVARTPAGSFSHNLRGMNLTESYIIIFRNFTSQ